VTLRQAEVLSLVAAGFTDKEIAVRLGITSRGVSKHLERLYKQLQLRNRADAARVWTRGLHAPTHL
jgi:DNA-binding CsgD family transcriptional regulator